MKKTHAIAATIIAVTFLAGCASPHGNYPASSQSYPAPGQQQPYYASYGVIESIQAAPAGSANNGGMGVGAVVGGVAGGLLGHQVGGGRGKTAATIAGAVGGAMVGNQMSQNNAAADNAYQLGIRLDNGGYQTVMQNNVGDLRVGSRVRIENGVAYRQY